MIRKIGINVFRFIKNETPPHLREQADFLAFFRALMYPLKVIADEWAAFRNLSITRAKVTGETISLAWYLNYLFDPTEGIYIETAGFSGLIAGDEATEPTLYFAAGDEATEVAIFGAAGVPGEGTAFQGRSFCVFVPVAVVASDEEISAIVNVYRFAGKTFIIQRF